jgi:pimeloyl-ACP methyl ester carboxylesterase
MRRELEEQELETIYHLVSESEFQAQVKANTYLPARFEQDGFIHCTGDADTVLAVANDYFAGTEEPVLVLVIETSKVITEVRFEEAVPVEGGGTAHLEHAQLFPHIYGGLNMNAVTEIGVLHKSDGRFHAIEQTGTRNTIAIESNTLVYSTAGNASAPPLLMLHGWASHRAIWQGAMDALKDRFYCVAIDLLGFGDSDKPSDADYGIDTQGKRILKLADALGLDRFVLVGHSMGGQIALRIASHLAPERVLKLVCVDGEVTGRLKPRIRYGFYPQAALGARFPWMYGLPRALYRRRWFANLYFGPLFFHKPGAIPFEAWERDRWMAIQPGIAIPSYRALRAVLSLDQTPHLVDVTAPALILFGRQDGAVPLSDAHLANDLIPDSRLVMIDECGHFPMHERPHEFLDALRGFLLE